ncbi:protein kinase domain-containing protein [Kallotenue papyrolyticum]|uniref:protein kinase domain-containing protein n=1 Tax=Kallotenue papyrolyticum TaxID=1325125 RepID=UPI00046F93DA|nr:protein kinase [Kallotenue papyrolyticum]
MSDPLLGRRLGKYVIQQEIGRGGMARVYRALDTVLQRPVALKVLAPSLSADPEFARRFEREAITAANLRHPAIVTIFDVGEAEGLRYIAMEYIAGRSLHDVLQERGRLPLPLATAILAPIAEALDFAHGHGMIHRDVKPHNILLDIDGRVLLTDFGIAIDPAADGERLTRTGMFMGTPEYIAPELAQGQPLTGKSDLYALGVVLFEMLAGRPPFQGNTAQLIMAHLTQAPPAITGIDPALPPELDQLFARLLAKDPAQRLERAGSVVEALRFILRRYGLPLAGREEIAALARPRDSSAGQATVAIARPATPANRPPASAAPPPATPFPIADVFGGHGVAPGAGGGSSSGGAPPLGPTLPMPTPPGGLPRGGQSAGRATIRPPAYGGDDFIPPRLPPRRGYADNDTSGVPWTMLTLAAIALATIALIVLLVRGTLNDLLAGPQPSRNPFEVVPTDTPLPTPTLPPTAAIVVPTLVGTLLPQTPEVVPTDTPALPTDTPALPTDTPALPTDTPALPTDTPVLPTDTPVLPTETATPAPTASATATVGPTPTPGPTSTPISVPTATPFPTGVPTPIGAAGRLLLIEDLTLIAYDLNSSTSATPISDTLETLGPPALSPDGRRLLVDRIDPASGQRHLFLIDRASGQTQRLTDDAGEHFHPAWRADGKMIVYALRRNDRTDIWTLDLESDQTRQITNGPGDSQYPSFSRDGTRILFESNRDGAWAIYTIDAGGGHLQRVTPPDERAKQRMPRWSPDGREIVFVSDRDRDDGGFDLYVQSEADVQRLVALPQGSTGGPAWSPDGRLIAFHSDQQGTFDIYIIERAGGQPRAVRATPANERWPIWGP